MKQPRTPLSKVYDRKNIRVVAKQFKADTLPDRQCYDGHMMLKSRYMREVGLFLQLFTRQL